MEGQLHIIGLSDIKRMNLPPVLYKYREFENPFHRKILTDNCVFFAAPNTFPDKKDCHPVEVFPSEGIVREHYWNKSFKEFPWMSIEDRVQFVRNQVLTAPIMDEATRGSLIEVLFSDYCMCHGVLSVTADPSNERMWNEYAKGHTGFCVGFDSTKLAMISGGGGPITYCDELPAIYIWVDSLEVEYEKRVFFKERHWEFEKEYRLTKTWPLSALDYEVERNIQLPEGCIVSVICGRNMKPAYIEELKRILAEKHPQAQFLQEV